MRILILTNIYPAQDLEVENTPVVHYFTKEWVRIGMDVRVVHYPANFPKFLMWGCSFFKKWLSSKLGTTIRTRQAIEKEYELDGVKVKRIPLVKYRLHGAFSKEEIERAYRETLNYLQRENFVPDCVVSHWVNPQVEIMQRLKRVYNCPTCYVAHTPIVEFTRIYNNDEAKQIINNIDLIGCRSQFIKDTFLKTFGFKGPTFQCYSGIPEEYIPANHIMRSFDKIRRYIFVGTLIKRKYPAEIIPALVQASDELDFELNYIGKGSEEKTVKKYAFKYGVSNKVHLWGRLRRDEVVKHLEQSDVFIMNSRSEAFGLVYLEAMAQGCITIASKKEGFDGIIKDGINGFLCEAGDINDLANTIRRIKSLPKNQLCYISNNAIETAKSLTDRKAADMYLGKLEYIVREKHEQ